MIVDRKNGVAYVDREHQLRAAVAAAEANAFRVWQNIGHGSTRADETRAANRLAEAKDSLHAHLS